MLTEFDQSEKYYQFDFKTALTLTHYPQPSIPLSGGSGENGEIDGGREADGAEAALEGCAAEALADVPPVEVQAQHVPRRNKLSTLFFFLRE